MSEINETKKYLDEIKISLDRLLIQNFFNKIKEIYITHSKDYSIKNIDLYEQKDFLYQLTKIKRSNSFLPPILIYDMILEGKFETSKRTKFFLVLFNIINDIFLYMKDNLKDQSYIKEIIEELKIYNLFDRKELKSVNFIYLNIVNDRTLSIDNRVKIYIAPYLDMKYRKDDMRFTYDLMKTIISNIFEEYSVLFIDDNKGINKNDYIEEFLDRLQGENKDVIYKYKDQELYITKELIKLYEILNKTMNDFISNIKNKIYESGQNIELKNYKKLNNQTCIFI
jgi:hypothetical protein